MSVKFIISTYAKIVILLGLCLFVLLPQASASGLCVDFFSAKSEFKKAQTSEKPPREWVNSEEKAQRIVKSLGLENSKLLQNHVRFLPNNAIELLVPMGRGYRVKKFKASQLKKIKKELKKIKKNQLLDFKLALENYEISFEEVTRKTKEIAMSSGSIYSVRLKSFHKLKDKFFDRAKKYVSEKERGYKAEDLHDLIAARLIMHPENVMMRPLFEPVKGSLESYYAKYFPDAIRLEVELKDKESGYRAIHIDITLKRGINFELQLLTEGMSLWNLWEHDTVYKSSRVRGQNMKSRLLSYGKKVSDLIYDIEIGNKIYSKEQVLKKDTGFIKDSKITDKHRFFFPYYEDVIQLEGW